MKPTVLVTRPLPPEARERLAAEATAMTFERDVAMPYEEIRAKISGCQGLVCVLTDRVDDALLAAAGELRVVSNIAVGYDNIDVAAAAARGIAVTNTPGVLTETTADCAWALMLATARRVVEADRRLRAGDFTGWRLLGYLGHDVHGKTLGIVGLGRIGQATARRAAGFGMRVLYTQRHRAAPELEATLGASYVDRETLLKSSHFVSLHTPLTPETLHWIDAHALALMRRDAILVNVARGPVVDEAALVEALRTRQIAGAGLDVYEREPEQVEGLRELDNAVLLPHVGSATHDTRGQMALMAVEGCLDVLAGRSPRFPVTP